MGGARVFMGRREFAHRVLEGKPEIKGIDRRPRL